MEKLKKISKYSWEIPKEEGMNVSGIIFSNENLLKNFEDDYTLEQIKNVARLPGILKNSFVMPDAHQGYGFPIGEVAGFDLDKGVICPEGIGYDINCGMRVLLTNIKEAEFSKKKKEITKKIFDTIPTGTKKSENKIDEKKLNRILTFGAEEALKEKRGKIEDLKFCEENGRIKEANPKYVSKRAKERGTFQLGTLGGGNHFIEIGKIEKIFDKEAAKVFGIDKNCICIMIHCGSRGLGHQVASDFLKKTDEKNDNERLTYYPIKSKEGKEYFSAMNCAANFAFYNRQVIMNEIRKIFDEFFPKNKNRLLYDVCHNIAKIETHAINGKNKKILVVRKGATRSFGPKNKEIPREYQKVGQPVIIPGSMGTASYILKGTNESEEISLSSTAHGAGRFLSRFNAIKKFNSEKIAKKLSENGIELLAASKKGIVEEAPEAYKDIEEVVLISDRANLAKKVAKIIPLGVIKG